jgi:inosine-uridine nucleoside N-ribohydrolase
MDARPRRTLRRAPHVLVLAVAAAAAALVVAAGPAARPAAVPAAPLPVVVDTDLSTDDVLALLYVLRRPGLDLRAVTVSGTGLVHCPAGGRLALELLALAGRTDVPVGCGRARPLAGDNQFPEEWRGRADALFGVQLPPAPARPSRSAVEVLHAAVAAAPGTVTLLSLAPLTNTADLFRSDPYAASKLAGVTAMGGAVGVPGNIGAGHERVEYNLWIDPVAAREVLSSGAPVTLVPLDATNDVPITVFFAQALRRYHYATPEATAAWELFVQAPAVYTGGQYFWDPLAAVALTDPSLLRFVDRRVRVVTAPGAANGRTVVSPAGAPVRVAVGAERAGFERTLLRALLGGAPFSIQPATAGAAISFDGRRCSYSGPRRGSAGQVAFDTVNRSGRSFRYVVGTLAEGKTVAQLRAVVRRTGRLEASSWFSFELTGETPPQSRMTWLAGLSPGRKALACTASPRLAQVVAPIVVELGR